MALSALFVVPARTGSCVVARRRTVNPGAGYTPMVAGERVVKTGWFLYDGRVRCPVRIVETEHAPDLGDPDEDVERARGHSGMWFRVELSAAGDPTHWASSIVGFTSLEEAVAHFDGMSIEWED